MTMIICKYYKIIFIIIVWLCATLIFHTAYFRLSERSSSELLISNNSSTISSSLTIHVNHGRLGNQMFTYATLFGLSKLNNRKMQMMKTNYDALYKYFDVRTPVINYQSAFVEQNPWIILNWLREEDLSIPLNSNIIKGNAYPNSYTFFHPYRLEVRNAFRFKQTYVKHAQDILRQFKRRESQVFVGVHVRRGDYINNWRGGWLKYRHGREVDMTYFKMATEYFKSKYDNVIFLAVSDDREWCRTNLSHLGIMTLPENPTPGHDMALLNECNHTIMTYGTFGFWGGYLAGGEVVYFSDFLKPNTSYRNEYFKFEKMYLPEWKGISTTKEGYWESYPFLEINSK